MADNLQDEELPLNEAQAVVERGFAQIRNNFSANDLDIFEEPRTPYVKEESPGTDEDTAEQLLRLGVETVIDLTEEENVADIDFTMTQSRPEAPPRPLRNTPPTQFQQLPIFTFGPNNIVLKPGTVVEINEIKDLYHCSFLKIQYVIQDEEGVILRGLPFTRTRNLRGQLPRLRNEVCLVLQIDKDDNRNDEVQAAVNVPVTEIIRTRILHCTNADFPENRFANVYRTFEDIEREGMLACRWKYRLIYKNATAREKNLQAPVQFVLTHFRANEVSMARMRISDTARLNHWRGSKVRGGSFNQRTGKDLEAVEDVDQHFDAKQAWVNKLPGQRYTVGDMFSGAGGTSLGARQAGFHIRVACDIAVHACKTHRMNFPETDLQNLDIWKFIREDLTWGGTRDFVDVLHLSPPCQFWSPAHTVEGRNDEANIAVLFSCHELIKKLKPRVFTLEQTFGILHPRFEHYFNGLIRGFTQYGYSVGWKVVDLREWGLPSRRNRLIMIGACPGENLPTFPQNTHAQSPPPMSGLQPFSTVMDAMRRIPPGATMHEKKHVRFKAPWNPNIPLARCITTHGGFGNYHFSGRRDFTLREYATMNGFPVTYQFHLLNAKRQIGNAFPPSAVRLLYGHLLKWLENEDRVRPVEDQSRYEEESDYEVVESDVEDDVVILEVKKRKKSESMELDYPLFCIDPSQAITRGSIIDLTASSPTSTSPMNPIVVDDEDNDIPVIIDGKPVKVLLVG